MKQKPFLGPQNRSDNFWVKLVLWHLKKCSPVDLNGDVGPWYQRSAVNLEQNKKGAGHGSEQANYLGGEWHRLCRFDWG